MCFELEVNCYVFCGEFIVLLGHPIQRDILSMELVRAVRARNDGRSTGFSMTRKLGSLDRNPDLSP